MGYSWATGLLGIRFGDFREVAKGMTGKYNILVKWATRERAELFGRNFRKWDNGRVKIVVSLDLNDPQITGYYAALAEPFTSENRYVVTDAAPAGKIRAMNFSLSDRKWDIVILAQDDVIPVPDYDLIIAEQFQKSWLGLDAVLYAPDGYRADDLNTQCVIGRKYFDRFGYIYHPDYKGTWCDNEFTEVSRLLGREIRYPHTIMRHDWIGKSPDRLLAHNESFFEADKATYLRRKAAGFPK